VPATSDRADTSSLVERGMCVELPEYFQGNYSARLAGSQCEGDEALGGSSAIVPVLRRPPTGCQPGALAA